MKIHTTQAYLKQSRWLVFAVRVTFNVHNLSIIGTFAEHNRKIFGAVQHSIIGTQTNNVCVVANSLQLDVMWAP